MRRAYLEFIARRTHSHIRQLAKADRSSWLEAKVAAVAEDTQQGGSGTFWELVRRLGPRSKQGLRRTVVLRNGAGEVIISEQAVVETWELKFLSEFGGNGRVATSVSWPHVRCSCSGTFAFDYG